MEVIIHWLKITFSTIDDPVGKCGPADLRTILLPVLFLTIKRKSISILLIHGPCHSRWGCRSFPQQRFRNPGFYNHRFFSITKSFFTGRTAIALAVVFDDFTFCGNEFQLAADILLSNEKHLCTADAADLFLLWKRDHNFFNWKVFEKLRMGCLFLAGMFPDHGFFLRQGWILFRLCFIEKILLAGDVIGSPFAGRTKKLFGQVIHLLLKGLFMAGLFINDKTERFDQLSLLGYHCFQL